MELKQNCGCCNHFDNEGFCTLKESIVSGWIRDGKGLVCRLWMAVDAPDEPETGAVAEDDGA